MKINFIQSKQSTLKWKQFEVRNGLFYMRAKKRYFPRWVEDEDSDKQG